jgi:hypothetical protein
MNELWWEGSRKCEMRKGKMIWYERESMDFNSRWMRFGEKEVGVISIWTTKLEVKVLLSGVKFDNDQISSQFSGTWRGNISDSGPLTGALILSLNRRSVGLRFPRWFWWISFGSAPNWVAGRNQVFQVYVQNILRFPTFSESYTCEEDLAVKGQNLHSGKLRRSSEIPIKRFEAGDERQTTIIFAFLNRDSHICR